MRYWTPKVKPEDGEFRQFCAHHVLRANSLADLTGSEAAPKRREIRPRSN